MYFPRLWTLKNKLDQSLIGPASEHPSKNNMLNGSKHGWNLSYIPFTIFIDYCQGNSILKSLLGICKILRFFVKRFTADDKYSLLTRHSLMQRIQVQLSQRQKLFSQFCSQLLKSSLNFEHFQKKHDSHTWCISKVMDSERQVRSGYNKSHFRRPLEN